MRRRWIALLLVLVLAGGVRAESCRSDIEVRLGAATTALVTDVRHTQAEAQDLRRAMDADRNAIVTSAEVAAFAAAASVRGPVRDAACMQRWGVTELDGAAPVALEEVRVSYRGAEGTVLAEDAVVQATSATVRHPQDGAERTATVRLAALATAGRAASCVAPEAAAGRWGDFDCAARVVVRASPGHVLVAGSVEPPSFREDWDGAGLRATASEAKAAYHEVDVHVTVRAGEASAAAVPSAGPAPAWPAVLQAVALGGAVLVALGTAAVAIGSGSPRWRAHGLLAGVLYTRLRERDLATHPRRAALLAAVADEPGLSVADLRARTRMAEGTLLHHLRLLERGGRLVTRREGPRRRVFLVAGAPGAGPYVTATERRLVDAVRAAPGATQKELAARLGAPRDVVAYHAQRLEAKGLLARRREGRVVRHYPG